MAAVTPILKNREKARALYQQGWRLKDIALELSEKETTLRSWKRRDRWADATAGLTMEQVALARYMHLVQKDGKSNADYKEIDALGRELERAARIRRYEDGGTQADLNPRLKNRNAGPKKQPEKNTFTDEQVTELRRRFFSNLFTYQKTWHDAGQRYRNRFILKSRQIGATYYFAREALIDALDTGRNQIFLSASKNQALQFRAYIVAFAAEVDVKLQGNPIVLPNGAELIFVSTNARTAQSYHGNLYVDETFWIPKFNEIKKTAGGMASHKQWRITYFSTPSAITHEAYDFWSGKHFNPGRAEHEHIDLDISHTALKDGRLCEDGIWRQIVTVEDAERAGCDLFDIDQLKLENSPLVFAQLYLCHFIDNEQAVFPFHLMEKCLVHAAVQWEDVARHATRPFGDRPVWVGYDPARSGDYAGLVVLAPPLAANGPFRVLEKQKWRGMDFRAQAKAIEKLCGKYRVDYIGIDRTGIGDAVHELVKEFFPTARGFLYSPEIKQRLIHKAYDVIKDARLQIDFEDRDIISAFMAIRANATQTGKTTYTVGRSDELSHADVAWATMHALMNEPLTGKAEGPRQSFMEIY